MDIYEPEFVKKLFNQMSATYERMNFITSFGFSILWRKQFIGQLDESQDKLMVLDLLSGLGENWNYLIQKYPNSDFHALDFSEEMIRKSREKNQTRLNNRVHIRQEDVLQTSLDGLQFDRIFCAFGLKTFNETQWNTLATQLKKFLKEDGWFSFIEISKPPNRILRFFYGFYLGQVIPLLGKLFLGNPSDYRMLWTYTQKFENCNRVLEVFKKHGLEVRFESYFWGCASGIKGNKTKIRKANSIN